MIGWMLPIGLVAIVLLVDHLLQGRREELPLSVRYEIGKGAVLDRMKLLRQQRRYPQATFTRLYHLR